MCAEETHYYEDLETRIKSFSNWTGKLDPVELAHAGFYYTGTQDICACFHCGVNIFKWEIGDSAIDEHVEYSPNCAFAFVMKKLEEKFGNEGNIFRAPPQSIRTQVQVKSDRWKWFPSIIIPIIVSYISNMFFFNLCSLL